MSAWNAVERAKPTYSSCDPAWGITLDIMKNILSWQNNQIRSPSYQIIYMLYYKYYILLSFYNIYQPYALCQDIQVLWIGNE